MAVNTKTSVFRIISFTLAGADIVQTSPDTVKLYLKQWKNRSLSPVCLFYAVARYMTIISLVTNGIGSGRLVLRTIPSNIPCNSRLLRHPFHTRDV
ncbi:hypothetical protein B0H19DRAFT_208695 [Mycena capillaripes]|nr:hypothetical protein B0H19DRAFT_208695 [Mycena capillaripes]